MGCLGAEFFPVVSVVADEVGDFTKSLVRYWHVFGMKGEIVLMFDELRGWWGRVVGLRWWRARFLNVGQLLQMGGGVSSFL